MLTLDWSEVFGGIEDVETLGSLFYKLLTNSVQECSSLKRIPKNKTSSIPKVIKKLLTKKKALWRKLKSLMKSSKASTNDTCALNSIKAKYKECSKELKVAVKSNNVQYEQNIIRQGSISLLYKYVNKKTKSLKGIPPLHFEGNLIVENSDKAEILNDILCKNFTVDNGKLPAIASCSNSELCSNISFTPASIVETLKGFKNSYAVGPDGFSAVFYKRFAMELSYPLFKILKTSFSSGILPKNWKTARVVPIYKKKR